MSLINEALKKAQRQRTADPVAVAAPAPGTAEAPVARIAKRRAPMPARTLVILVGGGVSLVLMAGLLTFLFWDSGSSEELAPVVPHKTVIAVNPLPTTPITTQPTPPVAAVPPVAPIPPPITPIAPLPPVITVKFPSITLPPPEPTPEVVAPPPLPTPKPPVTPPAQVIVSNPTGNPRVYQFLETLRVSGIRASETDPKVIMNDRVFRLNDLVDRNTQLRLIRVNASTLTFADGNGFEYQKSI